MPFNYIHSNLHFYPCLTGIQTWRIFVGGHREAGDTPSVMKHIGGVTKCV